MTGFTNHHGAELNKAWTCKLVDVAVFVLVCLTVMTLSSWHPLQMVPEPWRVILGRPPEAMHVMVIFVLYAFSVFILIVAAFGVGKRPQLSWRHLAYRCGFIMFYTCSEDSSGFFTFLVGGCLSLYVLELGVIGIHLHQENQHRIGTPT